MKKTLISLIVCFFTFSCILMVPLGIASEEEAAAPTPETPSAAAEKAAGTASMLGINKMVVEGVIFGTALALMATAISSGTDSSHGQLNGHGHGH